MSLKDMTTDELILGSRAMAADHGKLKHEFISAAKRYDHRTINTEEGREDDLIKMLEGLKSLREAYHTINAELKSRGVTSYMDSWQTLNDRDWVLRGSPDTAK